jgi:hypothetical protein
MMNMITLTFTDPEINQLRQALRALEESHKRNCFPALEVLVLEMRRKVADAVIDAKTLPELIELVSK